MSVKSKYQLVSFSTCFQHTSGTYIYYLEVYYGTLKQLKRAKQVKINSLKTYATQGQGNMSEFWVDNVQYGLSLEYTQLFIADTETVCAFSETMEARAKSDGIILETLYTDLRAMTSYLDN